MAIRAMEGIGSALAAVMWGRPQYVTLPAGCAGLGNRPDPLKILVVRRCDGACACASMALPPPVRAASRRSTAMSSSVQDGSVRQPFGRACVPCSSSSPARQAMEVRLRPRRVRSGVRLLLCA